MLKTCILATTFALTVLGVLAIGTTGFAQTAQNTIAMLPGSYYDPANCASISQAGSLIFCAAPPTATATRVPATATPVPPTSTPVPQGGQPNDSTPVCPSHNPTEFHGLYDAARNCHYDHEHHDNPNAANTAFGLPGAWYGQGGTAISYPWQTFNATTGALENDAKHNGYKWLVETNSGCTHQFQGHDCISDYRVEVHNLANVSDATVRFHSFQAEVRACQGAVCGTIRAGGWHDFGHLALLTAGGAGHICPGIPSDPPQPYDCESDTQRSHSSTQHQANFANWYGDHPLVTVQTHFLEYGPLDPNNPSAQLYYACGPIHDPPSLAAAPCTNPAYLAHNGSQSRIENLTVELDPNSPFVQSITNAQGLVNYAGYTDRYGMLANGCTAVGLDCVPLQISNLRPGTYWWRGDPNAQGDNGRSYDVSPVRTGTGTQEWIGLNN